jgi:RNA polymerase sigma-70 factor (ECF subfamily)
MRISFFPRKEQEVERKSVLDDNRILLLLQEDREAAIEAIQLRYGRYLLSIAIGILCDEQDAEECVNDVLMHLWYKSLPENIASLKAYLSRLTRNQAITCLRRKQRKKRGGEYVTVSYEELSESIPDSKQFDEEDTSKTKEKLNAFLEGLSKENRIIFMKRYWFSLSVSEIAKQLGRKERYVTNKLYVMRQKLLKHLKKEGE